MKFWGVRFCLQHLKQPQSQTCAKRAKKVLSREGALRTSKGLSLGFRPYFDYSSDSVHAFHLTLLLVQLYKLSREPKSRYRFSKSGLDPCRAL